MKTRHDDWINCLLGDVVTLKRGYDLPLSQRQDGPYPVITSSGHTGFHREAKVKGPGVVTGRYGTLGEVYFIENDFWPHNTVLYVQDFKGNHPRFVSYFLMALNFGTQNAAAAVPGVNRNFLHMIPVRVPPLPVQRRIAGILSAYDELIENSQRRIRILETMARGLYREWFVHFRFPGHADSPRVASALGEIPAGWEVRRVPECVHINPRVIVPRDGGKPFVPMGCLSNDSMIITDIESRTGNSGAKFQNGDTLFARITPCLENGKTGFVQFLPDDTAVACGSTEFIVLRSHTLTPEFVYCLARSDEFRGVAIKSMSGATGRQRVQERCFNDLWIAEPPRELLDKFTAIIAPGFDLIHALQRQIQTLRRTRDLLLPRLLAGRWGRFSAEQTNAPNE
jgi:type I restriction enzyme S subunit